MPRINNKIEIYNKLKEKIIYLQLEPGMILKEPLIAEEYQVSRTPVREAILMLSGERLVTVLPQSRIFVSYINVEALKEYTFYRRSMDEMIYTDLIRKKIKVSGQVEEFAILQEYAAKNGNFRQFQEYGEEFHKRLTIAAGHEMLWGFMEEARNHLTRYNNLIYQFNGYMDDAYEEHRMIARCIDQEDIAGLRELIYRHLDINLKHLDQIREKFSGYFE